MEAVYEAGHGLAFIGEKRIPRLSIRVRHASRAAVGEKPRDDRGDDAHEDGRSEERRVGKEWRYWRDWSSDVCSSDLREEDPPAVNPRAPRFTSGGRGEATRGPWRRRSRRR